jgi:acyl dehydratase
MTWSFPPLEQNLSSKDCILYALSLGYARDPLDEVELPFVTEGALKVVPSMASVVSHPSAWSRDPRTGINYLKIVHGQQGVVFHRPIPTDEIIVGQMKVLSVEDKGADKGALVFTENRLTSKRTGEAIATIVRSSFCRGDGGCGSAGPGSEQDKPVPQRKPDESIDSKTERWQALLYRLNGDFNPLHSSPSVAKKAGFERPILHGLCTYGIACRALLALCCNNNPSSLLSLRARFTSPVTPGETIRTSVWHETEGVRFECRVVERDKIVLGAGLATLN